MIMKTYVLNSVGSVRHIQVLRESYYSVQGVKAALQNRSPAAIAVSAICRITNGDRKGEKWFYLMPLSKGWRNR